MKKTFKYRLYPNREQQKTIDRQLELCRHFYNDLLEIKIETYKQTGKSLSAFDLNYCIIYLKNRNPEYKTIHSQVCQNISDRIYKAFRNMFFRIKRGEKAGFPRFKGKNRYKSMSYIQSGFKLLTDKKLSVSKIGLINIRKHREIKGKIKTMAVKKTSTNKYYVAFSCEVEPIPKQKNKRKIGIDVGLNSFLTTDKGLHIDNPKYLRKSEEKLSMVQRKHSRRKLRSKNRNKSRLNVALVHEKVRNQRTDFLHKLSNEITLKYGLIAIEDLNIQGMVQNHHLAKSINDAGWGMFTSQLNYKAEWVGGVVKNVERFYPSSQICSKCGLRQKMPLHKRVYKCKCGNVLDRDTNSAKNILNRIKDTVGITGINAFGDVGLPTSMNKEATHFNGW